MRVTYLYHSGFAVETKDHFLVFDYWRNSPLGGGLKDGVINPKEIANKDVIVFASHRHRDHFNDVILEWGRDIKKYRIILSDDISKVDGAKMIGARKSIIEKDFSLSTLKSNDEGVAFLLNIDGNRIFHAGDLNWWHWEGEPGSWNDDIRESYRHEIGLLPKERIDLAFVPVDPRLKLQYSLGIDYMMRNKDVKYVVPMHYGKRVSIVEKLLEDEVSEPYRDKIVVLNGRGDSVVLE